MGGIDLILIYDIIIVVIRCSMKNLIRLVLVCVGHMFTLADNPRVVVIREYTSYSRSTETTSVYQKPSWQGDRYNNCNPYATGLNVPLPVAASSIAPTPPHGETHVSLPGIEIHKSTGGGVSYYECDGKVISQTQVYETKTVATERFPKPPIFTKEFWRWRKKP